MQDVVEEMNDVKKEMLNHIKTQQQGFDSGNRKVFVNSVLNNSYPKSVKLKATLLKDTLINNKIASTRDAISNKPIHFQKAFYDYNIRNKMNIWADETMKQVASTPNFKGHNLKRTQDRLERTMVSDTKAIGTWLAEAEDAYDALYADFIRNYKSRRADSAPEGGKGKPCGKSHIPVSHKCGKGGAVAPQTTATPAEVARRRLLTGAGIAFTGALLGTIAKDVFTTGLPKDMVPPKTPPAGFYDNFEPGDLIYQAIEFGGSTRAHYAVYLGKQNGIHQVFDTSTRKVGGKPISAMRIRPIEEAHGRGTSYRLAGRLDRGANKKPTTEQLHKIIDKLQERSFNWNGFEENCETFARAVVNDLPVSTQSSQVSALTKLLTRKLVAANMPKDYTKRSINSNQIKRYVSRVVR